MNTLHRLEYGPFITLQKSRHLVNVCISSVPKNTSHALYCWLKANPVKIQEKLSCNDKQGGVFYTKRTGNGLPNLLLLLSLPQLKHDRPRADYP